MFSRWWLGHLDCFWVLPGTSARGPGTGADQVHGTHHRAETDTRAVSSASCMSSGLQEARCSVTIPREKNELARGPWHPAGGTQRDSVTPARLFRLSTEAGARPGTEVQPANSARMHSNWRSTRCGQANPLIS